MPDTESDAQKFERAYEALENTDSRGPDRWRFPIHRYTREAFDNEWLAAAWAQSEEIDRIAVHWATKRVLPEMSDEQCYWIHIRFETATRFLSQFVLADHSTVFRFPDMSVSEFHHWLLVDWWNDLGVYQAVWHVADQPSGETPSKN